MPVVAATILGTAALKGLKKAAPYLIGGAAAASLYAAHKYSHYKVKNTYSNTTIKQDEAIKINQMIQKHFSTAIDGLLDNHKTALMCAIKKNGLIKTDSENVSIITDSRIFESEKIDAGFALKNSKQDMEETVSQIFDSYFQKKENNEKIDKAAVIMHAIKNVCLHLIREANALVNIPGNEAKELLNNTVTAINLFLSNVVGSEYLMDKKFMKCFDSDRKKTIEDVAKNLAAWGNDQIKAQQALSSKTYFEANKDQAWQLFHGWAVFCLQTLDDELAKKRQMLTLHHIAEGYYSESARMKNIKTTVKNILPLHSLNFMLQLDNEGNKIKIEETGSLLKNYLSTVAQFNKQEAINQFSDSKLALSTVGAQSYIKDVNNQRNLAISIHQINHKVMTLNILLVEYVNSLEKYGTLPGVSAGTFEFKRLIIKDLIGQIKSDIKGNLKLPYYQALKNELETEKTTKAIKQMMPSIAQKNISQRSINKIAKNKGYDAPKKGPEHCPAFNAWEEVIIRINQLEKYYQETLEIVENKKKSSVLIAQASNLVETGDAAINDLQALTIDDYIINLSLATFHGIINIPKMPQAKVIYSSQVTVKDCYQRMNEQLNTLNALKQACESIGKLSYNIQQKSFETNYAQVKENTAKNKFIHFNQAHDYHDNEYKQNLMARLPTSPPIKITFQINFNAVYTLDDLKILEGELEQLIKSYNHQYKSTSQHNEPFYNKLLALNHNVHTFLEKNTQNNIGKSILSRENDEKLKMIEKLKNQNKQQTIEFTKTKEIIFNQAQLINTENQDIKNKSLVLEQKAEKTSEIIKKVESENKILEMLSKAQKETLQSHESSIETFVNHQLEEINKMKNELDDFTKKADNILEVWRKKTDAIQAKNNPSSDAINQLINNIESLKESLLQSLNFIESLTKNFKYQCDETINILKQQIINVDDVVERLKEMLNVLQEENTALKQAIQAQREMIESQKKEIDQLQHSNNICTISTKESVNSLISSVNNHLLDEANKLSINNKQPLQIPIKANDDFMGMNESLAKGERQYQRRCSSTKQLIFFCGTEVALIVSHFLPQQNYSNIGMSDKTINTFKEVTLLLAIVGLTLLIQKLDIKRCISCLTKYISSSKQAIDTKAPILDDDDGGDGDGMKTRLTATEH